jgi:membrane protein
MGRYLEVLKLAYTEWSEDEATRLGAALAFYTALSIAPLLVILIAVVGLVFGEEAARGEIVAEIGTLVGADAARTIEGAIEDARQPASGTIATILSIVTLVIGASGVVAELKSSLNRIWDVRVTDAGGLLNIVKDRLFSFAMILGVGFVLLVSLVVSAALSGLGKFMEGFLPVPEPLLHGANMVFSFFVVTALFALIYKYLPDAEVSWRDVWKGAIFTAVLFVLGKFALGLYLGKAGVGSAYGAAGSIIVLLVWVYYSAQIVFFGAEVTQVYANMYGSRIRPAEGAEPIESPPQVQRKPREAGAAQVGSRYPKPAASSMSQRIPSQKVSVPADSTAGGFGRPPGKLATLGGLAVAAGVIGLRLWNRQHKAGVDDRRAPA